MDKVKNFFRTTLPGWFRRGYTVVRNNPMKAIASGAVGAVILSSVVTTPKIQTSSSADAVAPTSVSQDADETTTTTGAVTTTTTKTTTTTTVSDKTLNETGTTTATTDNTFLSDYIKKYMEKVTFEDNTKPYIIDDEKLLEQNGYVVDENGSITNLEGYTLNGDNVYVSEDVVIDGNYYVDADGTVWTKKPEFTGADLVDEVNHEGEIVDFELIEDRTDETYVDGEVQIEGSYYIDENGIVWTSKEAYEEFTNPDYSFDGYIAPDGTKWTSEDEYKESLKDFEETEEPVVTEPVVTEPVVTEPVVTEPTETQPTETQPTEPETTTTQSDSEEEPLTEDEEYYTAPDGSRWTSKEEYDEYIEAVKAAEEPVETEPVVTEPVVTEPTETQPTETETTTTATGPEAPIFTEETETPSEADEYYTAPDGSRWTSKEEYDEYAESLKEAEELEQTTTAAEQETTTTTTTTTESKKEETTTTTAAEEEKETPKKTTTTTESKKEEKETTTTTPAPKEEEKHNDYFVAPDGSTWTSEEDYNEFISTFGEAEYQKTR